jgi:6-pyruvoyl-tetrahydropterin synthase
MWAVTIATDVSIVHRLHRARGRSHFLHGHTWTITVEVGTYDLSEAGTVVEFAPIKAKVREWLVQHVDRHVLLAATDPAVPRLAEFCCGGAPLCIDGEPTAELLAKYLYHIFYPVVKELMADRIKYLKVTVCEAERLSASYDGL